MRHFRWVYCGQSNTHMELLKEGNTVGERTCDAFKGKDGESHGS